MTRQSKVVEFTDPPPLTVGRLVADLDPGLLWLAPESAPDVQALPVTVPTLHDPRSTRPVDEGAVVLAVGAAPDAPSAVDLLRTVASDGAAAVVFKFVGDVPTELSAAARTSGVALLGVRVEMDWGQLYGLLRTAVAGRGRLLGSDATAVPAGDLFALANAVAGTAGGPSTIEDAQGRVLAYSNLDQPVDEFRRVSILGRKVPAEMTTHLTRTGAYRALSSSDAVVEVPASEELELRARMAIGVRAGGEHLGTIWVAEGSTPFRSEAATALRDAARIAALHLIRHRSGESLDRASRSNLLRSLLLGGALADGASAQLGLDRDGQFTVIAFDLDAVAEADSAVARERVLAALTLYWEAFRRRTACTAIGSTVYALLPLDAHLTEDRVRAMATELVQHIHAAVGVTLRAAIGPVVGGTAGIAASRDEADRVLPAMRRRNDDRLVADLDDVRGQLLLLELSDAMAQRPELQLGKLRRLAEHDAEHGTAYADSLRAYLDAFGDISLAAEMVSVHPKTFRYRLRRIREIADVRLDDAEERLALHLQLRFPPAAG